MTMTTNNDFQVVEFSMLNKRLFFPLSGLGAFTVQTALYPLVLLRTRLQLQEGHRVYHGLSCAITSIVREEGFRGLYSGYFVKSAQIVSGLFYASTYEAVRHAASAFTCLSPSQRSFIGGATASLLAQTLLVPVDIVSQHLMVLSRRLSVGSANPLMTPLSVHASASNTRLDQIRALTPIRLNPRELSTGWSRCRAVTYHIAKTHGVPGFYRGYLISLCTFVPSSAMWWAFYDEYCRLIASTTSALHVPTAFGLTSSQPEDRKSGGLPRLAVQLLSAPLAGISAAVLINPVDCVRVRMQVGVLSFHKSVRLLWATEGFRWLGKGLAARLLHTSIFSFWLVLIYEPVKLYCLKDEFRDQFRT